jgi:hypothetical protein
MFVRWVDGQEKFLSDGLTDSRECLSGGLMDMRDVCQTR